MARIRTIKPEFPESESMGRISRNARLCFIMLWTISDDAGRLRGNSRMLASLLFPYDDDAKDLIPEWLDELESEGCIRRYIVGKDSYIQIENWLSHQKVDKPSPSKIPAPSEPVANIREDSRGLTVGPRTKDQGSEDQGRDQGEDPLPAEAASQPTASSRGTRLPADWKLSTELAEWALAEKPGFPVIEEAAKFRDYWTAKTGKDATKADWDATWRNWVRNARLPGLKSAAPSKHTGFDQIDYSAGVNADGTF